MGLKNYGKKELKRISPKYSMKSKAKLDQGFYGHYNPVALSKKQISTTLKKEI